uniref:Uncharacterized protein n=1 Tax=Arundo donax TaxID=35708 RepID=A0A0A9ERN8_ARUDO
METSFPSFKGGLSAFKDPAIPLFPDIPGCYNEYFHEEIHMPISFFLLHHAKELKTVIPMYIKVVPYSDAELTTEEQMKCCFFPVASTKDIVVVVVL